MRTNIEFHHGIVSRKYHRHTPALTQHSTIYTPHPHNPPPTQAYLHIQPTASAVGTSACITMLVVTGPGIKLPRESFNTHISQTASHPIYIPDPHYPPPTHNIQPNTTHSFSCGNVYSCVHRYGYMDLSCRVHRNVHRNENEYRISPRNCVAQISQTYSGVNSALNYIYAPSSQSPANPSIPPYTTHSFSCGNECVHHNACGNGTGYQITPGIVQHTHIPNSIPPYIYTRPSLSPTNPQHTTKHNPQLQLWERVLVRTSVWLYGFELSCASECP